jgi:hypothetical protein
LDLIGKVCPDKKKSAVNTLSMHCVKEMYVTAYSTVKLYHYMNCNYNNIIPLYFQLGPWLAVEIPDMIEKGVVSYKEKTEG